MSGFRVKIQNYLIESRRIRRLQDMAPIAFRHGGPASPAKIGDVSWRHGEASAKSISAT